MDMVVVVSVSVAVAVAVVAVVEVQVEVVVVDADGRKKRFRCVWAGGRDGVLGMGWDGMRAAGLVWMINGQRA